MNKGIIYGIAAVVGIGAAIALFPKGDAPLPGRPEVAESASKGPAKRAKADKGKANDYTSEKRAPRQEADPDAPPVVGAKPVMDAQVERKNSTFGQLSRSLSPSWIRMGQLLSMAEQPELAARAREMGKKIAAVGRDPNQSIEEVMAAQAQLLEDIKAVGADGEMAETVARIEELSSSAGDGAPAPE